MRRACRVGIVLALMMALPAAAEEQAKARAVVTLAPLGAFPPSLVDAIAAGLWDELQVRVVRQAPVPLPRAAWYPARRRYRADKIIDHLAETVPGTGRVLGLASVDISTTKGRYPDWGVFGLGALGGRAGVISTFRLKRGARDADHLRRRVVDVAIHEIGHTLGLEHCTEPACVMRDAEGSIVSVDTSSGHLGPGCRALVEKNAPLTAR